VRKYILVATEARLSG